MSFDLRVLVVGQNEPTKYDTRIEVFDETQEDLRYLTWPFLSSQCGIMYNLGTSEDGLYNAMSLIDTNFEETNTYPSWINDEDVKSNLTELIFVDEYKEDLVKLLEQMISSSPMKSVLLLSRYQGGDTEVISGSMSFRNFLDALNSGNILFNVCYIIKDII